VDLAPSNSRQLTTPLVDIPAGPRINERSDLPISDPCPGSPPSLYSSCKPCAGPSLISPSHFAPNCLRHRFPPKPRQPADRLISTVCVSSFEIRSAPPNPILTDSLRSTTIANTGDTLRGIVSPPWVIQAQKNRAPAMGVVASIMATPVVLPCSPREHRVGGTESVAGIWEESWG
jgi:hypothetical protein